MRKKNRRNDFFKLPLAEFAKLTEQDTLLKKARAHAQAQAQAESNTQGMLESIRRNNIRAEEKEAREQLFKLFESQKIALPSRKKIPEVSDYDFCDKSTTATQTEQRQPEQPKPSDGWSSWIPSIPKLW